MMRHTFLPVGLGLFALVACTGTSSDGVVTGRATQRIINGTDSTAAHDAVVNIQIAATGPGAPPGGVCTGALIAPNLVLTARHCVSQGKGSGFACTETGPAPDDNGASGPGTDFEPSAFKIYTGINAPAEGAPPRATAKKLIHDNATTMCAHDIALLLLDTAITDVPTIKVRTDSPAVVDESATAVGWGVTEKEPEPAIRKQRTGVKVTRVGPAPDDLPSGEFTVGEAICSGDSGGPLIADSDGAVIGVVSRGGNDAPDDPNDVAKGCLNGTNFYTAASSFKKLIEDALLEAKGSSTVDAPDGGAPAATPPTDAGGDAEDSGCNTSGTSRGGSPFALGLAAMLVLGIRRRRPQRGA